MKILAVETSCDETAICLLDGKEDKNPLEAHVISHVVQSQIDIHKEFGGVFPAVAKREHAKNLIPTLAEVLEHDTGKGSDLPKITEEIKNKIKEILEREHNLLSAFEDYIYNNPIPNIDHIAVTHGPGLEPALWVGINFAKALSVAWKKPVLPVNHMEGHTLSVFFDDNGIMHPIELPSLALLVSGGHTELVLIEKIGKYKLIGNTRDDAAGEAFDKIARLMDLPYPGGPEISKKATKHREQFPADIYEPVWNLPRPMMYSKDGDFSFSGLKTAALYAVRGKTLSEEDKLSLSREVEDAIVEVLTHKTLKAMEETGAKSFVIGGGVSANEYLTQTLAEKLEDMGIKSYKPNHLLSTDNATMIAYTSFLRTALGISKPGFDLSFEADGSLPLA